ncbi:MAG: matrixin family metalloprotease [Nanoarchaeota archaeon]
MGLGNFLSFVFFIIVVLLLGVYWFYPFSDVEFNSSTKEGNFSVNSSEENYSDMQFYSNMRYPSRVIKYRISDCPLQKENAMQEALRIVENLTVLNYIEVDENEELYVTCDSQNVVKENLFVAGEGGPTKIVESGKYNVILFGEILIREHSDCHLPAVELHELFHTLGFGHSDNENNIMYSIYKCGQDIGDDMIQTINELYSEETLPDLILNNVSAVLNGRELDVEFNIFNAGLKEAFSGEVQILINEEVKSTYDFSKIDIGQGYLVKQGNILIKEFNVDEIVLKINYDSQELSKENNRVVLKLEN